MNKCFVYFLIFKHALESNYSDMVLSALEYYDYSVYESVGVNNAKKLHERGIKYLASDEQKERKYVPFENGCIHEEDKNYIIENKITAHEIARYTDGWYSCFPYPELFKTYDKNELKLNYLSILHTAMFARVLDRESAIAVRRISINLSIVL